MLKHPLSQLKLPISQLPPTSPPFVRPRGGLASQIRYRGTVAGPFLSNFPFVTECIRLYLPSEHVLGTSAITSNHDDRGIN